MKQENNSFYKVIVFNEDLVDGRVIRAKKNTKYHIYHEEDDVVYFIAENELICGIEKKDNNKYTIFDKEK